MPSTRVIAGAVVACLFICGLFGGQGMAQTVSTGPVGKPIQLQQPTHPGKSETRPPERSAAKHSSKAHPAAKKRASTKPAAKESTLNAQVTPNELMVDGETVRVSSPDDANDLDMAANEKGAAASDASPAAATVVTAAGTETIALADKSNSGAAAFAAAPSSGIGTMSWLLRVIAALSGAVAIGSIAWFLIGSSVSADVWVNVKRIVGRLTVAFIMYTRFSAQQNLRIRALLGFTSLMDKIIDKKKALGRSSLM